jgi:hypothetical protein
MGEPALKLRTIEGAPAETPAALTAGASTIDEAARIAAAHAADAARMEATPLGLISSVELVPIWPDGQTTEARQRGVRRYFEGVASNLKTAGSVTKIGGRWFAYPHAPDPTAPPECGSALADFVFLRTGRVTGTLLGTWLPPTIRAQLLHETDVSRLRFFGMVDLGRQLDAHEQRMIGVTRPESDRLYRADAERAAFAAKHGIAGWSARSVREWRAKVHRGEWPDGRGRRIDGAAEDAGKCSAEAWDDFRVHYLDPRRRSVRLRWELTGATAEKQHWAWPGYHTIARRVKRELPPGVADFYRLGPRRWEAKHQSFIERDRRGQYRPGESWVCDHTKENRWSLIHGHFVRMHVTIWVDEATGLILSKLRSRHPNSDTILAGFYAAGQRYGAPEHVTFDNGRDFRAKMLSGGRKRFDRARVESVMGRFGIRVTFAEAFHGQSKGVCERIFGPMDERFWKLTPTYCGATPTERPETLNADLRAGKIDVLDEADYERTFDAWIDAWNHTPREHLEGMSPAEAFNVNPIAKRTAPPEILAELCLPEAQCVVGRLGVQVRGLWYGQDQTLLVPFRGQTLRVRWNPNDASFVTVLDAAGRLICHTFNRRLTGVKQTDIREAKRRKKRATQLVKAAMPAREDCLHTLTSLAQDVAAQRRAGERTAERRIAVGAEAQSAPRAMQLLPGAAEAAGVLGARDRNRETLRARAWELLATPGEREPAGESPDAIRERLLHDFSAPMPILAPAPEAPSGPTVGDLLLS